MRERLNCIKKTLKCVHREAPTFSITVLFFVWLTVVHFTHTLSGVELAKPEVPLLGHLFADVLVYGLLTFVVGLTVTYSVLAANEIVNYKNVIERYHTELDND